MIIGIGSDLLDIRRIGKVLDRHDKRFINRCFTDVEIKKAERRRAAGTHVATYAKRFAAKEAMSKALGSGIAHGVYLSDIGVVNDQNGKPTISLSGGALRRYESLIPDGQTGHIHLTLTDEPPLAKALVIIESHPH